MFAQIRLLIGHLLLHAYYVGTFSQQHLDGSLLAVLPTVDAVLLVLGRGADIVRHNVDSLRQ